MSIKVLVVEDDRHVALALVALIEAAAKDNLDVECHCAYNFSDGMAQALKEGEFHGVVLDLLLPGSAGPEKTVEEFTGVMQKVPTVIVTGLDDAHLGMLCVEHGAVGCVLKTDIKRMEATFRDMLRMAREVQVPDGRLHTDS